MVTWKCHNITLIFILSVLLIMRKKCNKVSVTYPISRNTHIHWNMIFCKIYCFSTVCTSASSTQVSCFNSNILLKALQSRVIRIFSTDFLATDKLGPVYARISLQEEDFLICDFQLRLTIFAGELGTREWRERKAEGDMSERTFGNYMNSTFVYNI